MNDSYRPIDCGLHDHLESWAVRRIHCRVTIVEPGAEPRTVDARIDDLFARDGEEFARLSSGDVVRLDRIGVMQTEPSANAEGALPVLQIVLTGGDREERRRRLANPRMRRHRVGQ